MFDEISGAGADVVASLALPHPAGHVRLIFSALTLPTHDRKADLYVRRYDPIRGENGRTLVIVHGAGEHGGRYEHFIRLFVDAGWTVLAGDLRGHGKSGGIPIHLDSFDQYLDDLDLLWSHFSLDPASTAMFAHSMGGLVAVRFAQTRPEPMRALVLSAPLLALRVRVQLFKRAIGKVCHLVAPTTRFQTVVKTSDITRNPFARASRARDPLMKRSVTAGWYFSVRRALLESLKDAERFLTPLLLLQGGADQIVDPEWPSEWIHRVGSTDCTLRMLPDCYHEVINEPGWERLTGDVLQWFEGRFVSSAAVRSASTIPLPPGIEPLVARRAA